MAKPFAKLVKLLTPKRRWAQFSLATVFIVMTALCVVCAWLAVHVSRATKQRDAVAAVEAVHGEVWYDADYSDYAGTFFKTCLRRWIPRDFTDNVVGVSFLLRESHGDLADIRAFKGLRELYLDGEQVTDAGLRQLSGLTELQEVRIGHPVRAYSHRPSLDTLPSR